MTLQKTHLPHIGLTLAAGLSMGAGAASADIVHNDDVIITFSLCVGNDCVNGESFGFDTLRLKENNLRINFADTSNSASFPTNDWRIVANDTSNGGASYLAFEDSDAGRIPFRVEAGAPANSLVVESDGDIGIGTLNPVVDLHVVEGNTPTLRLEQDGSSGFTPQTWDVAGNEANFFVRDATNGSTLPFKIFPSAPNNALTIEGSTGDVGIGTTSPTAELHILGTGATLLIEDTNAAFDIQMELRKNGTPRMQFDDTSIDNNIWNIGLDASSNFVWTHFDNAGIQAFITPAGAMTIAGALTQNSDKNNKMAIEPVDPSEILAKVAALDVSAWTYKHDAEAGVRHIGPMAQDFYALFGLGASETGISTLDTSGVALAAIQALHAQNEELKARILALEEQMAK